MPVLPREIIPRSALLASLAMACGGLGCATRNVASTGPRLLARVTNEQGTVEVYGGLIDPTADALPQKSWERMLFGPGQSGRKWLRTPQGLIANRDMLWICDQGYPDVLKVSLQSGGVHNGTARAHRPAAPIAVTRDDAGQLYVVDATRRSVMIYSADGALLEELTGPSPQSPFEPTAVAIRGNNLFIADRAGHSIARYDLGGKAWLPSLAPADGSSMVVPTGLAFTHDGVLLISDGILGVIHRVDSEGNWLESFGKRGRQEGQLMRPIGICTTPGGKIAVADAARQAVVIFDASGQPLVDLHDAASGWSGWTLPTGVACLTVRPPMISEGDREALPGEWVTVSDMLGKNGLTLISVTTEQLGSATGKPEVR